MLRIDSHLVAKRPISFELWLKGKALISSSPQRIERQMSSFDHPVGTFGIATRVICPALRVRTFGKTCLILMHAESKKDSFRIIHYATGKWV